MVLRLGCDAALAVLIEGDLPLFREVAEIVHERVRSAGEGSLDNELSLPTFRFLSVEVALELRRRAVGEISVVIRRHGADDLRLDLEVAGEDLVLRRVWERVRPARTHFHALGRSDRWLAS